MEPVGPVQALLGVLLVVLVAAARFNTAPPGRPPVPDKTSRALGLLKEAFRFHPEPASLLFPPPRAQTTLFKFQLYRAGYALTGVAVYLVLYAIPGVASDVDKVLQFFWADKLPALGGGGPILIALVVALVLPIIPPLRAGEWAVRRVFYMRACIPAQQLRETHRLKDAVYVADPVMLQATRDNLAPDGFEPADLLIEEKPTTRSLWTKAALLMAYLEQWQADDRYKTAFATLHEQDGATRSIVRITEAYEALKPDARMCLRAAAEQPGAPETGKREETFRRNCRDLLLSIYGLLSRVSLHAHYTDRERIARLGAIGFRLLPCQSGPIPDPNDITALGVLITSIVLVPLSYQVSTPRAILISCEIYIAILVPILLAARFPSFARVKAPGTPALAFPVVSGLTAAAVGVVCHTVALSIGPDLHVQLARGWFRYAERSYPWTFLLLLIAALIAWRMRSGSYPDPDGLRGIARIRQWGSALDAARFGGASLGLMALYIQPRLVELAPDRYRADDWVVLLLPVAIAAVIGFFVPTWYRAHAVQYSATAVSVPTPPPATTPSIPGPLGAEARPTSPIV